MNMFGRFQALARRNTETNREIYTRLEHWRLSRSEAEAAMAIGALNHLLSADRIWLERFEGGNPALDTLYAPASDSFVALWEAREIEDNRIDRLFDSNSTLDLEKILHYQDVNRRWREDPIGIALARMFNHQVHHQWKLQVFLMSNKTMQDHAQQLLADFLSCRHLF
jgi:uncharacterized damage-inducible protein DinB